MNTWLLVANPDIYRIKEAVRDMPEFDWHKIPYTRRITTGDIVYIYSAAPDKTIVAKGKVVNSNVCGDLIDDSKFYVNENKKPVDNIGFFRIGAFKEFDAKEALSLSKLRQHGLKTTWSQKISGELLAYIESVS
ncbi:MAG: EVE domain-containing protein [Bacillota bacterium]